MGEWKKRPFWFDERTYAEVSPGVVVRCPKKHRTKGAAWRCGIRWMRGRMGPNRPETFIPSTLGLRLYRYDPETGTYK